MTDENLVRIRKMLKAAKSVATFNQRYTEYANTPNCDKHGYGFGPNTSQFVNVRLNFSFNSHKGFYGSSSCSTIELDTFDFEKHFRAAINKLQPEIFKKISESLLQEAGTLKEKAVIEVATLQAMLEGLEHDDAN